MLSLILVVIILSTPIVETPVLLIVTSPVSVTSCASPFESPRYTVPSARVLTFAIASAFTFACASNLSSASFNAVAPAI